MSWLDTEFREVGLVFELPTLDEDLLSLRFHASEGVKLKFERFAICAGVELDIVFLALMLYDNCNNISAQFGEDRKGEVPGMGSMILNAVGAVI
jgi:hypothetical protein